MTTDPARIRDDAIDRLAAALDLPREVLTRRPGDEPSTADAPVIDMCGCDRFDLWYTNDEDIRVCSCGHPPAEHLDDLLACVGSVIVIPGAR